jgi:hypothetical protein
MTNLSLLQQVHAAAATAAAATAAASYYCCCCCYHLQHAANVFLVTASVVLQIIFCATAIRARVAAAAVKRWAGEEVE